MTWWRAGGALLTEAGNIFAAPGETERSTVMGFIAVVGTMIAYFAAVVINFGDFSRFVTTDPRPGDAPDAADPGDTVAPARGDRDDGAHRFDLRAAKRADAARGFQPLDLRVQQLGIHGQLADLGSQPVDHLVPIVPRPRLQAGRPGMEKSVAPAAQVRRRHREIRATTSSGSPRSNRSGGSYGRLRSL